MVGLLHRELHDPPAGERRELHLRHLDSSRGPDIFVLWLLLKVDGDG
ncbi:hypothetical protein SDC9_163658 [bioreactor metagenome]|uniref:Uncharacterized protein n=1 Tax=bioreactor metagenome TaxID=1076179 RepID=A0A645FSA7_9ZZZZ